MIGDNGNNNSANTEQVGESSLCDIIAQQREFQLRQEARSSSSNLTSIRRTQQQQTGSGANNSSRLKQPSNDPGDQDVAIEEQLLAGIVKNFNNNNNVNVNSDAPSKQQQHSKQRRKFSLSYAMSNLASLGGGSGSSERAPPPIPKPPPAGKHNPQHRASLVAGELGGSGGDLGAAGGTAGSAAASQQQSSAEKKRGFVHKAIRRGSKMFDAMLLSSAQQQAQTEAELERGQPLEPGAGQTAGSGTHQAARVQFSPPAPAVEERTRRRKLRLGSIPHDLRRALSLSSNAHFGHSNKDRGGAGVGAAPQPVASSSSSSSSPPLPPPPPLGQLESSFDEEQPAPLGQLNLKQQANPSLGAAKPQRRKSQQLDSGRLRRKNSLFAPLSASVSPSALFHSHRREQSAAGSGEQPTSSTPAAANTSGATAASSQTSASFSLCQDHSRTYKLIIFGSSAVGKTSLIQRFLYGHFPVAHKPTIEELHSNKYNIPELGEIYLEILDTSGTFEFPAMRRLSIEKGDAFILVYSVVDEGSWQEVMHLRHLILEEKGAQCEQQERQQQQQQQQQARSQLQYPAISSSANNNSDEQKPISSIYAAAARLAAVNRRTMSSQQLRPTAQRRLSVNQPLLVEQPQQPAPTGSQRPTAQHYNSQLSRLLQQQQQQHSTSSGSLGNHGGGGSSSGSSSNGGSDHGLGNGLADGQPVAAARCSPDLDNELQRQASTSPRQLPQQQSRMKPPPQQQQRQRANMTPIVVVANKCDLDTELDQDENERMVCEQWGNSFVKCSAKESLNIDRVFKELLRQARAPEILSQFVIDDHQQRRQSLPVLKNQLSAHHVRGLRSLYNQQQLAAASKPGVGPTSGADQHSRLQQQEPRSLSSASEDSQCAII